MTAKRVAAGMQAAHVCGSAIMLRMGTLDYVALSSRPAALLSGAFREGPRGVCGGGLYLISQGSSSLLPPRLNTSLSQNLRSADGVPRNASQTRSSASRHEHLESFHG